MTKQEKNEVIEVLKGKFAQYNNFYVTDTESLTVEQVSQLRKHCFNQQVEIKVAKNTLIKKIKSLDWNIFDWGKTKTDKKALDISKEIVTSEKETFELNNKIQLEEQDFEIKKLEQLLLSDTEIIQIREKVIKSSDAQLKNGVITSSEYLIELTNLFEAKNILKTHEVQLAAAKSNYEIIKGK